MKGYPDMKSKLYDLLWEVAYNLFLDNDLSIKDIQYIEYRWQNEGDSFITKTLPALAKHIEQCIEKSKYTILSSFKKLHGTVLPHFLKGLTTQIFSATGDLIQDDHVQVAKSLMRIRQICYFFYKIDKPSTIEQEVKAVEKFLQIENENRDFEKNFTEAISSVKYKLSLGKVLDEAYKISSMIFKEFSLLNITPHDSSGAVADKRTTAQRVIPKVLYGDTNGVYKYSQFYDIPHCGFTAFISRFSHRDEEDLEFWFLNKNRRIRGLPPLEKRDYASSRFCLVPKDGRGPRIITIEPAELQYFQQGQRDVFVRHLESHPITRGHINFTDQTVNKELARTNSVTREYCTLDLSDASDRVTTLLVRRILPNHIFLPLQATRSHHVTIDAKRGREYGEYNKHAGTYVMHKFAGMGSGMCFPVEAVVFFCLAHAIGRLLGHSTKPYVYGDDIIAPHGLKEPITEFFKMLNLKINSDKSFERSFFRESCGGDFYHGVDITPTRMKKMPLGFATASSFIKLADRLHLSGQWKTERVIQKLLVKSLQSTEEVIGKKKTWLPIFSANYDSPGMLYQYFTKSVDNLGYSQPYVVFGKKITKYNRSLQKVLYPQIAPVKRDTEVIQEANYLRWFTRTRNTEQKSHVFPFFRDEYKIRFL